MHVIRSEQASDYREVEEVVREAFWNVYRPGCWEHLILHQLRQQPSYLADLSRLVEVDGKIVGQIAYSKAELYQEERGEVKEIAIFGPFSILPAYQGQGLGRELLQKTLQLARQSGLSHLVIFGSPSYYAPYGFVGANDRGIYLEGQDKEEALDFLLTLDLEGNETVSRQTGPWLLRIPSGYSIDEETLAVFDQSFPVKKKESHPGQLE